LLSNSIHRVVQHYIFVLEQLHIAGEFEDGSIRRLPRRQDQALDALLDFPFATSGSPFSKSQKILALFLQELSDLLVREVGQLRCRFRSQQAINFC